MKKGIKAAVITAAVCIVAGGVLMGAGVAAGGRRQLKEGDFSYIYMDPEKAVKGQGLLSLINTGMASESRGTYEGEQEVKGVEMLNGDFDYEVAYSGELGKLEIKIGVHGLEIVEGSGNEIRIKGKNCDRIQCYVQEGTLYVKDVGKNKKCTGINGRELVLTVPEGIYWKEAKIDADLGYVTMGTLEAGEAELNADMGSVEVERLVADKADLEANMGLIQVQDAQVGKLDATAGMGTVELEGSVNGDVEIEADMGSVELTLSQAEEDFNYEITADMGSVALNGEEYSGLSREKKINNGARWKMELDSSMGSIDICFE